MNREDYNYKLDNNITCHNCGKKGHYKKDCRFPTKTSNKTKQAFKGKVSYKSNKINMKNFKKNKLSFLARIRKLRVLASAAVQNGSLTPFVVRNCSLVALE
jgi:hypothetical protein